MQNSMRQLPTVCTALQVAPVVDDGVVGVGLVGVVGVEVELDTEIDVLNMLDTSPPTPAMAVLKLKLPVLTLDGMVTGISMRPLVAV